MQEPGPSGEMPLALGDRASSGARAHGATQPRAGLVLERRPARETHKEKYGPRGLDGSATRLVGRKALG
eukprot:10225462-Alexandrium_andersonii.AAC.1